MTAAGIVLYNPEIKRLLENINSIYPQVDKLILIDNASTNYENIIEALVGYDVIIIKNPENLGVAAALNQIAREAKDLGAEWVLTLDQDSVCSSELIENYSHHIDQENMASLTCKIKDRNFNYEIGDTKKNEYVNTCITSGNYINLEVWEEIGGFDEQLFIDKVDLDYCYRLVLKGFKILKIDYYGLLHEVGSDTRRMKVLGKEFTVFNHSPFRCYYITRNQIYFSRKYQDSLGKRKKLRCQRTAWTRIIVYLLFESQKMSKLKTWAKGIYDGYSMAIDTTITSRSLPE